MEIRKFLKKMLRDTSIFFTVISALYTLLLLIANVGDDEVLLPADRLLLIFMFAWLASLAQGVFRMKTLPTAARILLHYAIFALGFYFCFLLPASMTAAQVLVGLVLFTLAYAAVMGIVALFLSRFRTNAKEEEEYKSQFKSSR